MNYQIENLTYKFKLTPEQLQVIRDVAYDLSLIKTKCPFLDDIVIRAGFVLDTLLKANPHDIDALYTTKEQIGTTFKTCRCDEINKIIKNLDFKIFNKKYPLDLGHFFEGEEYIPLTEKAVGYHTHLMDVGDMVCINSKGEIWGNELSFNCINKKQHEIRIEGWLLFSYYAKQFPYNDYYYFYLQTIFRGLKMIISKNYKSVGSNYLNLLENANPILEYTQKSDFYKKTLNDYKNKKSIFMDKQNIEKALKVTGATNAKYISCTLNKFFTY